MTTRATSGRYCPMRPPWTSSRPSPSTRTAARGGACVIATLDITAVVALVPAAACVCASTGLLASAMLARIRQPCRRAGQFVFIAVLLDWSKFVYSPGVPPVFRRHLCLLHGRKRPPSKSFPRFHRTDGRLREGNRCVPGDWKPPRSCHSVHSRFRQDAACLLAGLIYREADSIASYCSGQSTIQRDLCAPV